MSTSGKNISISDVFYYTGNLGDNLFDTIRYRMHNLRSKADE